MEFVATDPSGRIGWLQAREEDIMRARTAMLLVIGFAASATLGLLAAPAAALAKDIPAHPLIRPYPGSVLAENMSKYNSFDAFEFTYIDPATGKKAKKTVKGKSWKLLYEVRTSDGARVEDITTLEFLENYKNAALEKGGEVKFEDQATIVFTLPRDDGGTTWCRVMPQGNMGQQYVNIIDEEGFKQKMAFGPAEMKEALDRDGRIALYGILFDLDKATLKQESDKQLQHIVTLLIQYPGLGLEVQGHTDSQGDDAYNLDLSQRRAEAVLNYLLLFGVDRSRLAPKGYGETVPVASNDTEDGRAKNRRVELVKK